MRAGAENLGQASGWSHDIRTHLNILLGAIGMIETGRLQPDQGKEYVGMIKDNALVMLRMLNCMLEDSSVREESVAQMKDVQVDGLLQTIVKTIKPYAEQNGLEFLYDVDSPLYVHCDPEMLERVLYNLLSNAVKSTEPGGFVYLSARHNGAWIEINVADTGCGLRDVRIAQLTGESQSETELGIGLKLVKSMMHAMESSIACTSRERVGTTFYLQFPAAYAGM